jgi:hypothetical protein
MNQKSSLREDLKFVSWMLTGNSESMIRVSASTNSMIVQRGMERETWDCSPRCQPTFSLGDSNKFASENAGQMQSRNSSVGGATQRPAGGGF